jgi:hypothetical protein
MEGIWRKENDIIDNYEVDLQKGDRPVYENEKIKEQDDNEEEMQPRWPSVFLWVWLPVYKHNGFRDESGSFIHCLVAKLYVQIP